MDVGIIAYRVAWWTNMMNDQVMEKIDEAGGQVDIK